ncbi:MAG: transporter substrate-binding domain-containing protein [Nitrospirota bacterium]
MLRVLCRIKKAVIRCSLLLLCLVQIILLSTLFVSTSAGQVDAPLNLRVGAYENQPKIYTDSEGNVIGIFPEILNHIATREGWSLKYVHGSWAESLERLENNEIDIMGDVAFSENRAQKYDFSDETIFNNWGTIYTKKGIEIDSLLDLQDKKVAVMKGSIHTDGEGGIKKLAEKFDIDIFFIEVDNYKEVLMLLDNKEADAGVVNRIFGSLSEKDYDITKTSIIFNPRQLKFAFPKKSSISQHLIKKIDHHVRDLKKNPDSIYHRSLYIYLSGLPREMIFADMGVPAEKEIMLTDKEKAWIRDHPAIRLGIDPEFAPFEYIMKDDSYSGIASDYIKILNERLGLNMQVVPGLTWEETVEKAKIREIDVLPCVGMTEGRKVLFNFSNPYINFHRVIITRTDTPFLTGLEDIHNLRVAVQVNTSHEGYLKDNTDIAPALYKTLHETLLAVSNGKADAMVGNIASATYWIRKMNLTNLKVAAPVSQEIHSLYFAVRKDWPELISIINKGLESISTEEKTEIRQRWVAVEYEPGIPHEVVWEYIMKYGGLLLLVLGGITAWNYRLKKEINKRVKVENELHQANMRLQDLDRLKSLFIASMSHELRTPLNSIIGFTGMTLDGLSGEINEEQKDNLTRAYKAGKHLLELITDVIDISKIEAGRIDVFPEVFSLNELIDEAAATIEKQLQGKGLAIDVDIHPDLTIYTDKKRLLQCIINFLSNAMKYTERGGVKVKAREIGDDVEISVSDTGIGISRKDMPRLFEAFERLETHLRVKAGGTGLGLYLTKKIATELLGGTIEVESEKGKGSRFILTIPKEIKKETASDVTEKRGENENSTSH